MNDVHSSAPAPDTRVRDGFRPPGRGLFAALERFLSRRSRRSLWLGAIAWYAVIFTLSSLPGASGESTAELLSLFSLEGLNATLRLLAHAGVFGILAILLYAALRGGLAFEGRRFWLVILLCGLLGLSDELHQLFVPLRSFRWIDVIADTAGGALALLLFLGCASLGLRGGTRPSGAGAP
jgi:VanZ family protein